MLRSVDWNLFTDVSVHVSGHISKGQVWTLKRGWTGLFRNVSTNIPWVTSKKSKYLRSVTKSESLFTHQNVSAYLLTVTTREQISWLQSHFS